MSYMFHIYEVPKDRRECRGKCVGHSSMHYDSKDWKLLSKHYNDYAAIKALTKYQHNNLEYRFLGAIEVHQVDTGRGPFGVLVSIKTIYGKTLSFKDRYPDAV